MFNPHAPIAVTLPKPAREMLMRAAAINPHSPPGASPERIRALEEAIARVKRSYPTYFQTEKE